jgi:glycosyltransferase involved in cell wall biosynthesis
MTKNTLQETLFFTKHTSLTDWDKGGMFEREVALYRRLAERGVKVRFVTYGGAADLVFQKKLVGIDITCNRWNLPRQMYLSYLTHLAPMFWSTGTIFKSNQLKGAEVGLKAARRFRRKFIVRCGYLHALTVGRQYGMDSLQAQEAHQLEQRIFREAHRIVVTTLEMKSYVTQYYELPSEKTRVIPNYVETGRFDQLPNISREPRQVFFVGRLEVEKNLLTLFDALTGLDVELCLAGVGKQMDILLNKAKANHLNVRFLGRVANEDLPQLLNQASVFILPSHYEGHPKALLEAMACGLPVIGTDVPGIREIIKHGENGWLCGTDAMQIRQALETVLGDRTLQKRLGENARQTVVDQFSLDRIVEMELNLLEEMSQ